MTRSARDEGAADRWKGGSVTPRSHNRQRSEGHESRSEERLADPNPPHQEPSGRELRRAAERHEASQSDDEPSG